MNQNKLFITDKKHTQNQIKYNHLLSKIKMLMQFNNNNNSLLKSIC